MDQSRIMAFKPTATKFHQKFLQYLYRQRCSWAEDQEPIKSSRGGHTDVIKQVYTRDLFYYSPISLPTGFRQRIKHLCPSQSLMHGSSRMVKISGKKICLTTVPSWTRTTREMFAEWVSKELQLLRSLLRIRRHQLYCHRTTGWKKIWCTQWAETTDKDTCKICHEISAQYFLVTKNRSVVIRIPISTEI